MPECFCGHYEDEHDMDSFLAECFLCDCVDFEIEVEEGE